MTDATGFGDPTCTSTRTTGAKVSGRSCYTAANSTRTTGPSVKTSTRCGENERRHAFYRAHFEKSAADREGGGQEHPVTVRAAIVHAGRVAARSTLLTHTLSSTCNGY